MKPQTTSNAAIAKLFFDQCVGMYSGHMSSIPNNPLFDSIFRSLGYVGTREGEKAFAAILRRLADELENAPEDADEIPF